MSARPKSVRKVLPAIPVGVEAARSPRTARGSSSLAALTNSPLQPRAVNSSLVLNRTQAVSRPKESVHATSKPKDGLPAGSKARESASARKPSIEGEDSSVNVAVRVRPFNKRELAMGAKQVVTMSGNRTTITSSKGKAHFFSYDHSFWSVDSSLGHGTGQDGVDQQQVYTDLAQPLLDYSFKGYNTCLFAYGQTGSGKSYCIMGEGEQPGIVPRFMRELFERIDGTSDSENSFSVQVSYFEIYNEKVYDLLSSSGKQLAEAGTGHRHHRAKLRVREHQVLGPYVEDLSTYVATSYTDIEHWLLVGNRCRATSATSMNDRSSRSHAVFSVTLTHTTVGVEEEHNTVSRINIIDLAGSERSKVSETSGDLLKEGASINRSLHSLGKVISLLSDRSTGRRDKVYIPYRDSTLTWLLKESLGGNSKTAMIATISPADLHYEESLSTLRYAQQARNIVNVARINEDPNVKMIRELTSEILKLKELLAMQGGEKGLEEIKSLRDQLSESEKLMLEATRSWQEKLRETESRKKEELEQLKSTGALTLNNKLPNLVNLTEDPQLSEMLLYVLKPGRTTVGNTGRSGHHTHDIELTGALVTPNHCVLTSEGTSVSLEPSSSPDAQTYVNGQLLSSPRLLQHGDRVVLGGDYFFRFNYPQEADNVVSSRKGHRDFEFARNELIRAQTERLEREWEEKILQERQQMLLELEGFQQTAQEDKARQQSEYQQKIQALNQEIKTKSQHLSAELQTKQQSEMQMEELRRLNQKLEEETIAQRHIIHLEKIKAEQESRELEEQTNQLMVDLAQEKLRLEEDIEKMHRNKTMRETQMSPLSSSESLLATSHSSGSDSSLLHRGSEVVRVSVMLQEATAICKALNKPLTFSREEGVAGQEGGVASLCVRVSNSSLNLVAYWDMAKFESRLEQMREVYQARGSVNSLDEQGLAVLQSNEDPFSDPSDNWMPSPLRSLQRTRSLSLHSTPSMTTPINRPLHFDLGSKSSQYSSPLLTATPLHGQWHHPALTVALQHMSRLQSWGKNSCHGDVIVRMLGWLNTMKEHVRELTLLRNAHDADHVAEIAFVLCCCMDGLVESSKVLHEQCLQWQAVMQHYQLVEHASAAEVTLHLQESLCHHTALYCSKLLKGEDVSECCEAVEGSLQQVAELLGQLVVIRGVQFQLLKTQVLAHTSQECSTHTPAQHWSAQEVLVSGFCGAVVRGMCARCETSLRFTAQYLQASLTSITAHQHWLEWSEAMGSLLLPAHSFLLWLLQVQEVVWNISGDAEPLPLAPVIAMMLSLHKLAISVSSLTSSFLETSDDLSQSHAPASASTAALPHKALSSVCVDAITQCNQLAVAVLNLFKTSPTGKGLSQEVQTHSQLMTQAGKALNQLLKAGTGWSFDNGQHL